MGQAEPMTSDPDLPHTPDAISLLCARRSGSAAARPDPVRGAPEIGGVLIRGEKGTAKSTAVRALAAVLADVDEGARLVELPIGATEDRVVGSLDLQRVLRDGEHAFSPGLLARAHGGVLYVDEVNLLHDHLVDVLLDAAAMGRVHVERDGVSHSHEARFMLVGTMNPEEGELRPQLLDRFGLTVDVRASRDVDTRVEVIRRRMDFEADPDGFAARYADEDVDLARRIALARAMVGVGRPAGQRVTPDRRAVCVLRRGRDAGRPGGRAHGGGPRGLAWRRAASRSRTSGSPPNWRCHTAAAATRSTTGPRPGPARRGDEPGRRGRRRTESDPSPTRSPTRARSAGRRGRVAGDRRCRRVQRPAPATQFAVVGAHAQRRARADVPRQGAGGARSRRGCPRPAVACAQPDRHPDRRDRGPPRRVTDCTSSARCWPPPSARRSPGGRGSARPICGARSGRAGKAIW